MHLQRPPFDPHVLDTFVALVGAETWARRMAELARSAASGPRVGQIARRRHGLELALERLRGSLARPPSAAEQHAARFAADVVALERELPARGKARLQRALASATAGDRTLVPLFHLLRTAALQRARGFRVQFAALADGRAFDLLIANGPHTAEVACDVVSAEAGRLIHRSAWAQLADDVEPELHGWLAKHPGLHLLKLTLPRGLDAGMISTVRARIHSLLTGGGRLEHDDDAVLRLDPLSEGAAQLQSLRQAFGPEAHLSATASANGRFIMAARAGREDEVGVALRRRLADITPTRLSGTRPGILAMCVEDTDREEWRGLRDRLELEGEARQFLAGDLARRVIAISCASRLELFGVAAPDATDDGELRFRNPAHPAAKSAALAPAVLSSV